jgi:plasmid stabilization system protein ParE
MANRRGVFWSPQAIADVTSIWDYYAEIAGIGSASRVSREIDRVITVVEHHLQAGRPRDELEPGLRSIAAKPFSIFYRVVDQRAQIVRVLDTRRNIESLFIKPSSGDTP